VIRSTHANQAFGGARFGVFSRATVVTLSGDGRISAAGSRLEGRPMQITIDTREDSFEDALGVLRRAYGRHRLARKTEASPAVSAAVDVSGVGTSEESDDRPASESGRADARSRKPSATGTKRSAPPAQARATGAAAVSSASKSTPKRASGKTVSRNAPAQGRPGASRKRSATGLAANIAPRGQSEAVRAWAQEKGMRVSTRGRMPARVISAYMEAHNA
jgi:hypothetical protein